MLDTAKKIAVGAHVFFERSGFVYEGRVVAPEKAGYRVHWNLGGTSVVPEGQIYTERETLVRDLEVREKKRVEEFEKEISTERDLFQFMLKYVVAGENCDYAARTAVLNKASSFGLC